MHRSKRADRDARTSVQWPQALDDCFGIVVADTGQGINPEFLPRMFDRFSQQDPGAIKSLELVTGQETAAFGPMIGRGRGQGRARRGYCAACPEHNHPHGTPIEP